MPQLVSFNDAAPMPYPARLWVDDAARPGHKRQLTGDAVTEAVIVANGGRLVDAAPTPTVRQLPAVWDGANDWVLPAKPLVTRKAEMKAAATRSTWAYRTAGVTVTIGQNEVTLATTHEAAVELLEASSHVGGGGSLKVVTRSGARLTLNTAVTNAARTALRGRFAAGTEAEFDLHAAIDDAADHDALDLIDPVAGTIDGVSVYP